MATDKGNSGDSAVFRAILQELKNLGAGIDGVRAETASLRDGMSDLRVEMAGLREDNSNGFAELRAGFEALSEAQRETNAQLGLVNARLDGIGGRTKRAEERITKLEKPPTRAARRTRG